MGTPIWHNRPRPGLMGHSTVLYLYTTEMRGLPKAPSPTGPPMPRLSTLPRLQPLLGVDFRQAEETQPLSRGVVERFRLVEANLGKA